MVAHRFSIFMTMLLGVYLSAASFSFCTAQEQASVDELVERAMQDGDAHRGALVFGSPRFACISCHQIGKHGGRIGPNLSEVGKQRTANEIVESLLFPQKVVKPEFLAHLILTDDGVQHRGYLEHETNTEVQLRDPSSGEKKTIRTDAIEARKPLGTLMPEGLTKAMTSQQLSDVLKLLLDLGHAGRVDLARLESVLEHAVSHVHGPAKFEYERDPLQPELWPHWKHPVNRDRVYDFYAKQAEHFRVHDRNALLLSEFPGLDGGNQGHWGNQNEETWADGRWNSSTLGTLQCGVFRGAGKQVVRGFCIRLSDEISACFDPDTLTYPVVWKDGFLEFSAVRHGFMHGLKLVGEPVVVERPQLPEGPKKYLGLSRYGDRVLFRYQIGETEYLDAPTVENGKFVTLVKPIEEHPLRHLVTGGLSQWPQKLETEIKLAETETDSTGYVVDSITPPFKNPWNALMFFGGNAFLPDGSALLCTMQGDVWHVSNFEYPSQQAVWKRFASGLHQPQGIWVDDDGIFVLGRDQITRLHDLNGDHEADYYECFANCYQTSPAGHDYICGLERDQQGFFYTASGNQGLLQISPDGQQVKVLATGFRNPDGLGITSDGVVTVPCSEGSWTPASMICAVPTREPLQQFHPQIGGYQPPFFGLGGPRDQIAPDLPMVYLPRGIDNSSGGQIEVTSDRWGPLQGEMIHFSFGSGSHSILLRDQVRGQLQGGIVPLPAEFLSGVHRGRFSPADGQLYASGMAGWGSYTPDDGCFQRVRYTGKTPQLPVGFHAHENGIMLEFTEPIDPAIAEKVESHFAQAWNYRYSPGYGSPEFSTRQYGTPGHDVLKITQAVVLDTGRSLFLEIPELQPVNQLHLRTHVGDAAENDLFLTVHALDTPFRWQDQPVPSTKDIAPHPILKDVAYASKVRPNRWTRPIPAAREIVLETGTNLTFKESLLHVKAGEPLKFTLRNPDVVPHNWALIRSGTLMQVGDLANRLIADPDAFITHYIPDTQDVIVHTDVVQPNSDFTIYFHAPKTPGTYPYLCTFPGHWLVMNGKLIVE